MTESHIEPRSPADVWGDNARPLVREAAEVDDGGGPWEWHAELSDGADVTSLPFKSFAACALDALVHGLRFAATSREAFTSLAVRRARRPRVRTVVN